MFYEQISKEAEALIKALNKSRIVATLSLNENYDNSKKTTVIFQPVNDQKWERMKDHILILSDDFLNIDINIYQWHRSWGVDWVMEFRVSPKDKELQEENLKKEFNEGLRLVTKAFEHASLICR